jgi:hypothetical protein
MLNQRSNAADQRDNYRSYVGIRFMQPGAGGYADNERTTRCTVLVGDVRSGYMCGKQLLSKLSNGHALMASSHPYVEGLKRHTRRSFRCRGDDVSLLAARDRVSSNQE